MRQTLLDICAAFLVVVGFVGMMICYILSLIVYCLGAGISALSLMIGLKPTKKSTRWYTKLYKELSGASSAVSTFCREFLT